MTLPIEDFIEMLERGDSIEVIAEYCKVQPESIERRFFRLPKELRDEIMSVRQKPVSRWRYQ
jgi:hypothetical protein